MLGIWMVYLKPHLLGLRLRFFTRTDSRATRPMLYIQNALHRAASVKLEATVSRRSPTVPIPGQHLPVNHDSASTNSSTSLVFESCLLTLVGNPAATPSRDANGCCCWKSAGNVPNPALSFGVKSTLATAGGTAVPSRPCGCDRRVWPVS